MRLRGRLQLACVLATGMVGLSAGEARADSIPIMSRVARNGHSVGSTLSMDGTLTFDLAYARRFRGPLGKNNPLQLEARLSLPLALIPDYGGIRLGGTASTLVAAKNGLGIVLGAGPDILFSRNDHSSQFAFGVEGIVRPGYWGSSAMVALDLQYRLGYATCIIHRAPVDALYGDRYPGASAGPQEGCLPVAAQRFRFGLIFGGIDAGSSGFGGFHIAGGFQYTPQIGGIITSYPLTPLPFYVNIGAAYKFGI
jgi:hypothetical protein